MSLNEIVSDDVAARLEGLEVGDYAIIIKAASVGLTAQRLFEGVRAINNGDAYELPGKLGTPRPLVINAWSFVNDKGQYRDTYGLSDAVAGTLKGQMRDDPDSAIAEITRVVSERLRMRQSPRPVRVSRDGMPGSAPGGDQQHQGQGGVDFKTEIKRQAALYGMYTFVAEDTGRTGPYRFRVPLGACLYAVFQNKRGAVDVARITRVHGRSYALVEPYVAFWRNGKPPLFGKDIPDKVKFYGVLKPGEASPADPVEKDMTVA